MSGSAERLGRTGWIVLGALAAASVAFDLVRDWSDPTWIWDYPLFFVLVGLGGAVVLTVLAKVVLTALIDRPEDYYDRIIEENRGRIGDDASLEGAKKGVKGEGPEESREDGPHGDVEPEEDARRPAKAAESGGRV